MMFKIKIYASLIFSLILLFIYNIYQFNKPTSQNPIASFESYLLHKKYNDRFSYKNNNITEKKYLINSPGCVIPHFEMKFEKPRKMRASCGHRAIHIQKVDERHIRFLIDFKTMNIYTKGCTKFTCCYRYVTRSKTFGREDSEILYSTCNRFRNGTETTLDHEFINVICKLRNKKCEIYEDSYAIVKKVTKVSSKRRGRRKWNVLIIGMDTMSRARMLNTMPLTVQYFKQNDWLDFRGYNKVGRNTLPNVMAILTGKNYTAMYERCSKGMTECNEFLMWSHYREAGYVTLYGEDHISLPDTFNRLSGFSEPPTHHYLRPLFLTGEKLRGTFVCTKTLPSAHHILSYTTDFVKTYSTESFFGLVWINSYSHDCNAFPTLLDSDIVRFLEKLKSTGALANTFVTFMSDHGMRFGPGREAADAHYAERLPMLFMSVPERFRNSEREAISNAIANQYLLTSPYDFYMTLSDILSGSDGPTSEACPRCVSLFKPIPAERNCALAGIPQKWCACHTMEEVDDHDNGAIESIYLTIGHLQNMTKMIKTTPCTECYDLRLDRISSIHFYSEQNRVYYVVVLFVSPENIGYEAIVEREGNDYSILTPVETISRYNQYGGCVLNSLDVMYCVCIRTKCR